MTRDAETTSRIMASIRNRDTKPELALRTALGRRGLRYRLRVTLPGSPDIVFPGSKVVVFVDGDFWHGNAWRVRGMPSFEAQFIGINNSAFWRKKILCNMERDSKVNAILSASGWIVLRVFESSLLDDIEGIVSKIESIVRSEAGGANGSGVVVVVRGMSGEVG